MPKCENCVYAEWDYNTYYGTSQREYFISGCTNDMGAPENEECEEFEEYVPREPNGYEWQSTEEDVDGAEID